MISSRSLVGFVTLLALAPAPAVMADAALLLPSELPIASGASRRDCFVPGQPCEAMIVDEINRADATILFMAYGFTSAPIGKALLTAKRRGVQIEAVLDKSNQRGGDGDEMALPYSGATLLINGGIPVVIDDHVAIAHNKVIIIDAETARSAVITGSMNWTRAGATRNAENVLVIRGDASLTQDYVRNFRIRQAASTAFTGRQ
jgi:phosphatidylserine/phosphatidylglycerophosphate/cardiolipin synthase-like enzyme